VAQIKQTEAQLTSTGRDVWAERCRCNGNIHWQHYTTYCAISSEMWCI